MMLSLSPMVAQHTAPIRRACRVRGRPLRTVCSSQTFPRLTGYSLESSLVEKLGGLEGQVLPALPALQELLGGDRQAAAAALLRGGSALANANPAKLHRNFQFAVEQGLSEREAGALLRKVPQVFCAALDSPATRAKLRYFQEVLGVSPRDMLLHHCLCLSMRLVDIDQRVFVMERRGELRRLLSGGPKLAWVLDSPLWFCARMGVAPEEFQACLEAGGWVDSERPRRYQLVEVPPLVAQ